MMFEIFPWNNNLETGIDIIDEQHKRLVQLLNQLAAHLANRSHKVTLTTVFSELAAYADYHFKSEEEIWSHYLMGDELLNQHKTAHDAFFAEVQALQKKSNDDNLEESIREIVSFLAKWLAFHILDSDKKMAIVCLAVQKGMLVPDAILYAEKKMSGSAKILIDTILNMYDSLFNRTVDMMREQALRRQAEDALKERDEHLRFLMNGGQEGVWEWHIGTGESAYAQSQVADILAQLTPLAYVENRIHPDDLPLVMEDIQNHLSGKTEFFINKHRVLNNSGLWSWVSSRGKVVERDKHGRPIRMMGTNTDITARELALLVYNHGSQGMFVADSHNQIISINPAFTSITGFVQEDVIGKKPSIFDHKHSIASAIELQLDSLGYWSGEIDVPRKNGERYTAYFTLRRVNPTEQSGNYLVGLFTDVSQMKKAAQQLWKQTNFDQLTQLPNRHQFNSHLQDEINKAEYTRASFSLLLVDLDEFKTVNDGFGHETGDELLKVAASRILNIVSHDGFVARISGDEFAVILSDMAEGNRIERLMHQLLEQLAEPYYLAEHTIYISASIGVSVFPEDADTAGALLKNADQAMCSAKSHGRNRFCYFTPSMQEQAQKRQRLITDMRTALKTGQFCLYYQPIVDIKSGRVCKAEALVRWLHPELGIINPVEFIPLAEDTGLIIPLGEYIYAQAFSQLRKWRHKFGSSFQISVNKSPIQFQQEHREKDWIELLQADDISGFNVIVEITESVLMNNSHDVVRRLQQFKNCGIQVAVDDFGTGYSSLSYLNKFQVDFIKIDRSFTNELELSPKTQALCEAMISMAHKLNIQVVAEGVETAIQLQLLQEMNCDFAQGYLFSPPVSPNEFEKLPLSGI